MLRKEECARGMGQRLRSNYAAKKDAQMLQRQEECASGMGQSTNYAAKKDAQIKLGKEDCALGMGHITIQMMNLQHLDQSSNRVLLQLNPNSINMLLYLPSRDEVEKAFQERWPSSVKKYKKFNVCVFTMSASLSTSCGIYRCC